MAILRRGEWRFCKEFQHFEQGEEKWFTKMTNEGQQRHIKKVMECSLTKNDATQPAHNRSILPVTPEATGITTVALPTLHAIWQKAHKLLSSPGHILNAAWSSNPHARLVASSSSQSPHFVTTDDKQPAKYICDGNCPMFRGFGICAHVVAAAHHNRQLELFVQWFVQTKCRPNLTAISREGLPKGAGRKGGVEKRKRKKTPQIESHSKRIRTQPLATAVTAHSCLAETDPLPSTSWLEPHRSLHASVTSFSSQTATPDPSCSTPSLISASPNLQPSSHTLASTSLSQMVPPVISASQGPSHRWGTKSLPDVPPLVSAVPSSPPALVSSNPHDRSPYTLCFITGNIRVCRGCRQKYTKPCIPPMDLCVRHQEWQQFTRPGASAAQVRYGNVYYHCNIPCIQARCPSFTADMLIIPAQIALQLLPCTQST